MTAPMIDLDAAKRESQYPDGINVRHGATDFVLPAELPADVLDPILLLDLPALLKKVLDTAEGKDAGDEDDLGQIVLDVLFDRPDLPADLLNAVRSVFAALFGPDQYPVFLSNRPSIPDYVRLIRGLLPLYGVSLGEALGSADSSESGGATSNPTSSSTTDSTPAPSGGGRKRRTGSSASGG